MLTATRTKTDVLSEWDRLKEIIAEIEIPPLPDHFNDLRSNTNTPVNDLRTLCGLVELARERVIFDRLVYVEIGSWAGSSALAVASRSNIEVHCVDHWKGAPGTDGDYYREIVLEEGDVFSIFKENVRDYLDEFDPPFPSEQPGCIIDQVRHDTPTQIKFPKVLISHN